MGRGQGVGRFAAAQRRLGHCRAARVAQAQGTGHLVEGLARGVIYRAPQHAKARVAFHLHNMAVAAGCHKA